MSIQEIGKGILPNSYITKINVSHNQNEYFLKITMSLKDILDGEYGYWYNSLIHNVAKINLVCIATTTLQDQFNIERKNLISDLNQGKKKLGQVMKAFNVYKEEIPLSLAKNITTESHLNDRGQKVHDFYYHSNVIKINKHLLKDVYLYSNVFVDLEDNILKGITSKDLSYVSPYAGPIKSEIVFQNGEIVKNTQYFIMSTTSEIWIGNVIYDKTQKQYFTHPQDLEENKVALRAVSVPNPKINLVGYNIFSAKNEKIKSFDWCSELNLTVDDEENVVGNFFIDFKNLLIENVEQAKIMYEINPFLLNVLAPHLKLNSLKLYRTPITTDKSFNSLYTFKNAKKIAYIDEEKIVVEAPYTKEGKLISTQRFVLNNQVAINVNFKQLPIGEDDSTTKFGNSNLTQNSLIEAQKTGEIKEVSTNLEGVALYSFIDILVKEVGEGLYYYSIEVEGSHNVEKYILNYAFGLKEAIKSLSEYKLASLSHADYNFEENTFKETYIKNINSFYGFDRNMATKDFIFNERMQRAPWVNAIYFYKKCQEMISTEEVDVSSVMNNLNPMSATQQTIEKTIKDMTQTLQLVLKLYNYTEADFYNEPNFNKISTQKGDRKSVFAVIKEFEETFDVSQLNYCGYHHFNTRNVGLLKIGLKAYRGRAQEEINKFFKEMPKKTSFKNLNTSQQTALSNIHQHMYSYFTPYEVQTGTDRKKLINTNDSFDLQYFNNLNLQRAWTATDIAGPGRSSYLGNPAMLSNATVGQLGFEIGIPFPFAALQDQQFVDADKYLGTDSPFITGKDAKAIEYTPLAHFNVLQNIQIASSIQLDRSRLSGRVPSIQNFSILPNFKNSQEEKQELTKLPLPIKSLIDSGDSLFGSYDVIANPITRYAIEVNYFKIKKIQYLNGFEQYKGLNVLKNPLWKIINKDWFESIESQKIYCRQIDYKNSFYSFMEIKDFKSYNNYFIIDGELKEGEV